MPFVPDQPTKSRFVPDAPAATEAPTPREGALNTIGSAISNSPITGGAELLGSAVTGALARPVAGIAGLGSSLINKAAQAGGHAPLLPDAADVIRNTEGALTYQPASASGKAGAETLGKGVSYVGDKVDKGLGSVGQALGGDTGENLARTLVPAVADAAASVTPLGAELSAGRSAARTAAGVVEGGAKPVVGTGSDAVETGRAAGFKFTPGGVESRDPAAAVAGKVPQSFATEPTDRRAVNLHNQANTTSFLGENVVGKPGATALAPADFDKARVPHYGTYKETGAVLGDGLKGSSDLVANLEGQLADTSPTQLKGAVLQQTNRILNAAKSGNLSGPQMVKDISWLRANGGRSVAGALESEMETQLAATPAGAQQLGKFRDARTALAQIKNLQDATKGGQVDASKLAAIDQKNPGLLTGPLKLVAQTAAASPQDFRLPSGVQPGSSPLSKPTWAGAVAGVGKKAAKIVAPGRFDVTSDAFQNRFGRVATPTEASYIPGLGKRPAPPTQGFELQAPQGSAAVPPRQLGMEIAEGPAAAPKLDLAPPEGTVGITPQQLGAEISGGGPRPPREELPLTKPEGTSYEPLQRGLDLPEPPKRPKPKAKKSGKD